MPRPTFTHETTAKTQTHIRDSGTSNTAYRRPTTKFLILSRKTIIRVNQVGPINIFRFEYHLIFNLIQSLTIYSITAKRSTNQMLFPPLHPTI